MLAWLLRMSDLDDQGKLMERVAWPLGLMSAGVGIAWTLLRLALGQFQIPGQPMYGGGHQPNKFNWEGLLACPLLAGTGCLIALIAVLGLSFCVADAYVRFVSFRTALSYAIRAVQPSQAIASARRAA